MPQIKAKYNPFKVMYNKNKAYYNSQHNAVRSTCVTIDRFIEEVLEDPEVNTRFRESVRAMWLSEIRGYLGNQGRFMDFLPALKNMVNNVYNCNSEPYFHCCDNSRMCPLCLARWRFKTMKKFFGWALRPEYRLVSRVETIAIPRGVYQLDEYDFEPLILTRAKQHLCAILSDPRKLPKERFRDADGNLLDDHFFDEEDPYPKWFVPGVNNIVFYDGTHRHYDDPLYTDRIYTNQMAATFRRIAYNKDTYNTSKFPVNATDEEKESVFKERDLQVAKEGRVGKTTPNCSLLEELRARRFQLNSTLYNYGYMQRVALMPYPDNATKLLLRLESLFLVNKSELKRSREYAPDLWTDIPSYTKLPFFPGFPYSVPSLRKKVEIRTHRIKDEQTTLKLFESIFPFYGHYYGSFTELEYLAYTYLMSAVPNVITSEYFR